MYVHLKTPRSVEDEVGPQVDAVLRFHKSQALTIPKRRLKRLERDIVDRLEDWETNTAAMRDRLKENMEFFEGKEERTDFPFGAEDSSNLDTRYAVAQCRTMRASFIRTALQDSQLVSAKLGPGVKRDVKVNENEAAVNWVLSEDSNGLEILKETPTPIFRDGTALVYGEWARRVERGVDSKTYVTRDEFVSDYPSAKEAGVSQKEYDEALQHLDGYEGEVNVEYELDFVAQNGLEFTTFPLAKFIWYPLFSKTMRDCEMYGYFFRQSGAKFEHLAKQGYYREEGVEVARKKSAETHKLPDSDDDRDAIEGINSGGLDETSYQLAKLVVCDDLDDDGIQERYQVIWDMDSGTVLRIQRYSVRRNIPNIVPFRFIKRSGRLLGESLLRDGIDMYREINALHRHRSNVRRLTDSVTLIMPETLKERVDLGAEYAYFRPGQTLWVPDQFMTADKSPRQLQIYNTSRSNDSLDEEKLVMSYLDMENGITQGQSGRETPQDPNAPAAKTKMLLARADLRSEDLTAEWASSIPDFVDLAVALVYQNAPKVLKYMARSKGEQNEKQADTSMLVDSAVRYSLKSGRFDALPEVEMNKLVAMVTAAVKLGVPQTKPRIIGEFWNAYVLASRIEDPDRFMVEGEQEQMALTQSFLSQMGAGGQLPGPAAPPQAAAPRGGMDAGNNGRAPLPGAPVRPGLQG